MDYFFNRQMNKKGEKEMKILSIAVSIVIIFASIVFAEHIGDTEIYRLNGSIEMWYNWPEEITLSPGEKMIFVSTLSNTAYDGEKGLYKIDLKKHFPNASAWITIRPVDITPEATVKSLSFSMNGKKNIKIYIFPEEFGDSTKRSLNMSIEFPLNQKDIDNQKYKVAIKNNGKKLVRFNPGGFSTVPELNSDWKSYYNLPTYKILY